mmetsp:Transcript_40874/g.46203  ORF Transcript_40874/g.46203 Transcript_40874/m.46203 type:complete len:107 (+) Transcript_40874:30-350(+)
MQDARYKMQDADDADTYLIVIIDQGAFVSMSILVVAQVILHYTPMTMIINDGETIPLFLFLSCSLVAVVVVADIGAVGGGRWTFFCASFWSTTTTTITCVYCCRRQ